MSQAAGSLSSKPSKPRRSTKLEVDRIFAEWKLYPESLFWIIGGQIGDWKDGMLNCKSFKFLHANDGVRINNIDCIPKGVRIIIATKKITHTANALIKKQLDDDMLYISLVTVGQIKKLLTKVINHLETGEQATDDPANLTELASAPPPRMKAERGVVKNFVESNIDYTAEKRQVEIVRLLALAKEFGIDTTRETIQQRV